MPLLTGIPGARPGTGAQWTGIGPAPLRSLNTLRPDSGEVVDIAIDPSGQADQVVYIACNDGGIWKSTDAGASWTPRTELMPSLSMGAVAVDPADPNVVYAGTGNLFDGGAQFSKGVGIYRSVDGGETWSIVVGSGFAHAAINRIVLPGSGLLVVATINGVFRSVDGGRHFGANAPTFDDDKPVVSRYASGLLLDTQTPTTVYACIAGGGLLMSTDGGATFPVDLFANPGAPVQPYDFVALAQSTRPDGETLYASVSSDAGYVGLFRSADGGGTWNSMPAATAAAAGGQFGYDQTVGVDPLDPDRVYLGFQQLHVSTDGGVTFQGIPVTVGQVHEDHHALVFSPATHRPALPPSQVYVGTDGGIATSPDGGATWLNLNNGIATNLFLGIDIGRGTPAGNGYTYGGTQDTGLPFRRPGFPGDDWHMTAGGDGGQVAVDPGNPLRAYGCTNGSFLVTTDGGNTWTAASSGLPVAGVTRVSVDPRDGANVYASSGATLYQSTDHGAHFTAVKTFAGTYFIRAIAIAPLDSNTVWVALDLSLAHTGDALAGAGATWTNVMTSAPGWMVAESLAIDGTNTSHLVAAYSGLSGINPPDRTAHVFQTMNAGATWTDISGTDGGNPLQNLPDLPLHAVVLDPGTAVRGLFGVRAGPGIVKGLGGPLVAAGLDGIIVTSTDGVQWTIQRSGTAATLLDAVWAGIQWVVVGLGGAILTSPDGVGWTSQSSRTSDPLQGIAWSGSLLVVSDASGSSVLTSPDGVSWTARPVGAGGALLGIAWDGRQFIGVGYGGTIVTSPDGISWTSRTSGTTAPLVAIASSATTHVAAGQSGSVVTSPDGITWTARTSGTTAEINDVAWSGSLLLFAAVLNTGGILTSPDGITWTPRSSGTGTRLLAITWTGFQFVAVGDFGTILTSPDGTAWTPQSPGSVPASVIVASDAGVMRSLDGGATWYRAAPGLPAVDCKSLALDTGPSPSLLRVGTYGRSVFELTAPDGPALVVEANLAFGFVAIGSSATLAVRAVNTGSAGLEVVAFSRSGGSGDFSIAAGSAPVRVAPGTEQDFTIEYTPSAVGNSTATFRLYSTDPAHPVIDVPASGTGV